MPDLTPQSIERLRELQEVCRENADLVKRHVKYAKDWRDFADALAAAVAVLEKLPVTADGVVVAEPCELWWWDGNVLLHGAGGCESKAMFADPNAPSMFFEPNGGVAECYSSEAAAQATKEPK